MRTIKHEKRKKFCFECGIQFESEIEYLGHGCKPLPPLPPPRQKKAIKW